MTFGKKLYLQNLWKHSRLLFFIVIIFILGQAFFTYKGVQTFPFINFGVYSSKYSSKSTYKVYDVYLDDQKFNISDRKLTERDDWYILIGIYDGLYVKGNNKILITNIDSRFKNRLNIDQYNWVKNRLLDQDNAAVDFSAWLELYFRSTLNQSFDSIQLYRSYYQYQIDQKSMQLITTEQLF